MARKSPQWPRRPRKTAKEYQSSQTGGKPAKRAKAGTTRENAFPPYDGPDIVLTLVGAPRSATNSKRVFRGKRGVLTLHPSKAAVDWRTALVMQMRAAWDRPAITGLVAVDVVLYRDKRSGDVDNPQKAILDALQTAQVVTNDALVDQIHVFRSVDPLRPRIVLRLRSITNLPAWAQCG